MIMPAETEVLFINDSQVRELITQKDVIDAVEDTFISLGNGMLKHPKKFPLWLDDDNRNMLIAMPAYMKDEKVAGVKWYGLFHNQKAGLPSSIGGLLILNSGETGAPIALIEANSMTVMRTGGGHAVVAAKYLANPDSRILAIIGCGAQGRAAMSGFTTEFEFERIKLYNRSATGAERLQKEYSGISAEITCCETVEEAVRDADIVVCATASKQPIITCDMAKPGMTLIALNSFHELDPAFGGGNCRWILGNKDSDSYQIVTNSDFADCGLRMENVTADLGEVVTGKTAGRISRDEIVVYTHMGMGSLDIACGIRVYRKAKQLGMGQKIVFNG